MADDNVPDIEWVDDEGEGVEWVDEPAQKRGAMDRIADEAADAFTPRGIARKLAPSAFIAAEELGAWGSTLGIPGAQKLYTAATGKEYLTPDQLAALRTQDPIAAKNAERRQQPALFSAQDEIRDMGEAIPALVKEGAKHPLDTAGKMLGGMAESMVETGLRGGIRREAPISSTGDIAAVGGAVGGLRNASVAPRNKLAIGRDLKLDTAKALRNRMRELAAQRTAEAAKEAADRVKNAKDQMGVMPEARALSELEGSSAVAKNRLAAAKSQMLANEQVRAARNTLRDFARETKWEEVARWKEAEGALGNAARDLKNAQLGKTPEMLRINRKIQEAEQAFRAADKGPASPVVREAARADLEMAKLARDQHITELVLRFNEELANARTQGIVHAQRDTMYATRADATKAVLSARDTIRSLQKNVDDLEAAYASEKAATDAARVDYDAMPGVAELRKLESAQETANATRGAAKDALLDSPKSQRSQSLSEWGAKRAIDPVQDRFTVMGGSAGAGIGGVVAGPVGAAVGAGIGNVSALLALKKLSRFLRDEPAMAAMADRLAASTKPLSPQEMAAVRELLAVAAARAAAQGEDPTAAAGLR